MGLIAAQYRPRPSSRNLFADISIYLSVPTIPPSTTNETQTEQPSTELPILLDTWEACVQNVIRQRCAASPDSQAVESWDGSFTYKELDELSDRLASLLSLMGIVPETYVPICMGKSRWAVVAVLKIIKSGAAFSLLDAGYPLKRIASICRDLSCPVILSDKEDGIALPSIAHVLVVEQIQWMWHAHALRTQQPAVSPSNALYVAFTSGTTGRPKGVIVEHRSYCSGAKSHSKLFQLDHSSRVLQFASYAFDVSIMETLSTLMAGGCLCIPHEIERTDPVLFAAAVVRLRASHAFLTPSFARTVPWRQIETVSTLVLGGELMRSSDVATYTKGNVSRLLNAYGPSECSVNALVQPYARVAQPNNIGFPTGCIAWVVDPDDPGILLPLGTVGELLIEGPIVGRGYLNQPTETKKVFVEPPSWLRALRKDRCRYRLYRTGDLVSQNPDGSLTIHGRKDRQVKLLGSRMECEEIEDYIMQALPDAQDVVVEKVTMESDRRERLIAFTAFGNDPVDEGASKTQGQCLVLPPTASDPKRVRQAQLHLREVLPAFMIPSVFIRISQIPLTQSGKVDRGLLRRTVEEMSPIKLREYSSENHALVSPTTSAERALQRVYAEIFKVPPDTIGMNNTFIFMGLGGDSILAARLASAARQQGLMITVQDLLGNGNATLAEQVKSIESLQIIAPKEYVPFSLLPCDAAHAADYVRMAAEQCRVEQDDIEDIYPCTPLQEGMITASLTRPGMYMGEIIFEIPADADAARLKQAWQATADVNPILRTRIVQSSAGLVQVVLRKGLQWGNPEGRKQFDSCLGSPLIELEVIGGGHSEQSRYLVATIHHAIWDRRTMKLVQDRVEAAYHGTKLIAQPFAIFMQYLLGQKGLQKFWAAEMANLDVAVFPASHTSNKTHKPSPTASLKHKMYFTPYPRTEHTAAEYIHLAWSLLVTHYTDAPDAVYGVTVHGRSASVVGIDDIVGPTIATVPLRVTVRREDSVEDALSQIRRKCTNMIPYQHQPSRG
ncbi:hypothetical protein BDW69DRAFT_180122 [Aspergillus filifer]